MLFTAVLPLSVFASKYENGKVVDWSNSEDVSTAQQFRVDGEKGYCCQPNTPAATSGTATVTRLANDSLVAKVYWKYCIQKGWDEKTGGNSDVGGLYYQLCVQAMNQYAYCGKMATGSSWTQEMISTLEGWVNELADQDLNIPSNFEVYYAKVKNGQDFTFFLMGERIGSLKLKKASAIPGITG